jgi:hypothetical protein
MVLSMEELRMMWAGLIRTKNRPPNCPTMWDHLRYQTNVHAIFNYKRQGWALDGIRRVDRLDQGRMVDVINFAMFRVAWADRNDR